ncbi:MAG: hypothetical protein ACREB9_08630, partial [Thermoplasmata archaeon]
MIAVGLARFGLDLPEKKVPALFEDGWNLPLVQSTVSRLSLEFLVRWRMFCEERLPSALRELEGIGAQFDGTGEPSGRKRVTYRAREASTGLTLWSEPLEAEDDGEVFRFCHAFRDHYGTPLLGLRDDGKAVKKALALLFPGMPVGEDHWHYFDNLGPVILRDYPELVQSLTDNHGLSNLTKWSHTLPWTGWGLEALEKVWVRATLEWIEEARKHPGGFPWELAYWGLTRRL